MNKELIKTYFEEFNHWINGGKILAYYIKDDEPRWYTDDELISCDDIDNFTNIIQNSLEPEDVLIIIDDEYIEFRGALANGKIVEYLDFRDEWRDLKENCVLIEAIPLKDLRIKPEHKFKVGDWVIHNGVHKQVTKAIDGYIDSLDNQVAVIMKEDSLEPWEAQPGEWCWVGYKLMKFNKLIKEDLNLEK